MEQDERRTVADAIRSHPEYLGGSRRDVTTFIQRTPGAIAKDGAEAVYAVGLAETAGTTPLAAAMTLAYRRLAEASDPRTPASLDVPPA